MIRQITICAVMLCGMQTFGNAQQASTDSTTSCNFEDGKQISVRYGTESHGQKDDVKSGKIWTPAGQPMLLFTQTALLVNNTDIPTGAYSLYFVPGKGHWLLIVNKDVDSGNKYNKSDDLMRISMDTAEISQPANFNMVFGHMAPKQCNLRVYEGKNAAWAEFHEK